MSAVRSRVVTTTKKEYAIKHPCFIGDLEAVINDANYEAGLLGIDTSHTKSLSVRCTDDEIIISFEVPNEDR